VGAQEAQSSLSWSGPYPFYLGLTLLVELLLVLVLARQRWPLLVCLLVNCLTHPLAFFAVLQGASIWWIEILVLGVETAGYALLVPWSWRRAFLVALVCNGVTTGMSWIV